MLKGDVVTGVRKSWEFLKEVGLGELLRQIHPLDVNERFRRAALGGASTYERLYLVALETQAYNIMLRDFSLLQFGWFDEDNVRYAFLPNPRIRHSAMSEKIDELWRFVNQGAASLEEALRTVADIDSEPGVPLVRYENSVGQRKEFRHPCSHFHIGFHSENWWPVERVITPSAFTMLVVKLYYQHVWNAGCADDTASLFEKALLQEREAECRPLPVESFSETERRSFHVA